MSSTNVPRHGGRESSRDGVRRINDWGLHLLWGVDGRLGEPWLMGRSRLCAVACGWKGGLSCRLLLALRLLL